MSIESATGADQADASKSSKGKGRASAAAEASDGTDQRKDKDAVNNETAGSNTNGDTAATTGEANGDGAAAESSTSAQQRGQPAPIPAETPDELRAQLEVLRRELATNLQKKQNIDRQLVGQRSLLTAHC